MYLEKTYALLSDTEFLPMALKLKKFNTAIYQGKTEYAIFAIPQLTMRPISLLTIQNFS